MATPADRVINTIPAIVTVGAISLIASQVAKMSKTQRKRIIQKKDYYCRKCKRRHRYGTNIYREHVVYGR